MTTGGRETAEEYVLRRLREGSGDGPANDVPASSAPAARPEKERPGEKVEPEARVTRARPYAAAAAAASGRHAVKEPVEPPAPPAAEPPAAAEPAQQAPAQQAPAQQPSVPQRGTEPIPASPVIQAPTPVPPASAFGAPPVPGTEQVAPPAEEPVDEPVHESVTARALAHSRSLAAPAAAPAPALTYDETDTEDDLDAVEEDDTTVDAPPILGGTPTHQAWHIDNPVSDKHAEYHVEFKQRKGTLRFLLTLLTVFTTATAVAAYTAVRDQTLEPITIAVTMAVITGFVWATWASTSTASLSIKGGILEIHQDGKTESFGLTSAYTSIEVKGRPTDTRWMVLLRRDRGPVYVVDRSMVKPKDFMRVLKSYRPDL